MTIMFFYRNKHMMCDFGTGNNNKLNWVLEDKQELIDIIETIYKGARKGRGLVVSPKGRDLVHWQAGWQRADGVRLLNEISVLSGCSSASSSACCTVAEFGLLWNEKRWHEICGTGLLCSGLFKSYTIDLLGSIP